MKDSNKTNKKRVLLLALTTIGICSTFMVGGTYALFTSESKTNVTVTSGKVDLKATISEFKTLSPETIVDGVGSNYQKGTETTEEGTSKYSFVNGGYASLKDNQITLDNITPGDKVTFKVTLNNESTVNIKYRTSIKNEGDDSKLFDVLKVNIGKSTSKTSYWTSLAANNQPEVTELECSIEMPASLDNDYAGLSAQIAFTVEAVQGNAKTYDEVTSVDTLKKALEEGKNDISLANDITLTDDLTLDSENLSLDLNGKTLKVEDNKKFTLSGENTTLSNGSVKGYVYTKSTATLDKLDLTGRIFVESGESKFTMTNCSYTASGLKDGNAYMPIKASDVELTNNNFDLNNSVYNFFEQNYSADDKIKSLKISDNKFDCNGITHNVINLYAFEDGANIDLTNNEFINDDFNSSQPFRFSNINKAKNVSIDVSNTKITTYTLGSNDAYNTMILFQDDSTDGSQNMSTFTVTAKNISYVELGTEITTYTAGVYITGLLGVYNKPSRYTGKTAVTPKNCIR